MFAWIYSRFWKGPLGGVDYNRIPPDDLLEFAVWCSDEEEKQTATAEIDRGTGKIYVVVRDSHESTLDIYELLDPDSLNFSENFLKG